MASEAPFRRGWRAVLATAISGGQVLTSARMSCVWLVRAGRGGRHAAEFEQAGIAAIGWRAVGDLGNCSREEVVALVRAAYGDRRPGVAAGMLFRFASEIAVGDWVLMPESRSRSLFAGRVAGGYEHRPGARYPHVRPVSWSQRFGRDELPPELLGPLFSVLTVFRPSTQDELRAFLEGGE